MIYVRTLFTAYLSRQLNSYFVSERLSLSNFSVVFVDYPVDVQNTDDS